MPEHENYVHFIGNQSIGEHLGITPLEIKSIVHHFYQKVKEDKLLGPVFANQMSEDWDHHLNKMCDFWSTVMFGKPLYKGNPLQAHAKISEIEKLHFQTWLQLFKETLQEICPSADHVQAFYQRANNMALVMTQALIRKPETLTARSPISMV